MRRRGTRIAGVRSEPSNSCARGHAAGFAVRWVGSWRRADDRRASAAECCTVHHRRFRTHGSFRTRPRHRSNGIASGSWSQPSPRDKRVSFSTRTARLMQVSTTTIRTAYLGSDLITVRQLRQCSAKRARICLAETSQTLRLHVLPQWNGFVETGTAHLC